VIKVLLLADTHLGFDLPLRPRVDKRRRGPHAVGLSVQFSTAVSRNPPMIAIVKPKTISWLCQEMLSKPGSPDIGS
jgi:hypothetical protein